MRARMLAVLSLGLVLAVPAAAQRPLRPQDQRIQVRGTVVDAMSGTPLPNTMVRLVEANLGVLADSLGRFTFAEVPVGRQTLAVKQYGYDEIDTDLDVSPDLKPLQVQLQPGPYAIEGFDIVADRLAKMKEEMQDRRNAAPVTVRSVDQGLLARSSARDMREFLQTDAGVQIYACGAGANRGRAGSDGNSCLLSRGRLVSPTVYIDESFTIGGLDELATYHPYELYGVELFGGARPEIHVYTHSFVERMASHPFGLMPYIL